MGSIEAAARALCAADGKEPDGWDHSSMGDPYWMFYRDKARTVLEAIRQPTDAMIEEGASAWRDIAGKSRPMAENAWKAMIETALGED